MQTIVIALGGNALQEAKGPATAEAQLAVVKKTCALIAPLARDNRVLVVHGNGPQVGRIVLQNEHATPITPAMPFDVCGAMSQGLIGYHLQQGLSEALQDAGIGKTAVTVLTQVVVDANDPGFQNPTKPIGPFYTQEEAEQIAGEKGYTVREDAGRGWRRVVASPDPVRIVELSAIRALSDAGFVPVCVGGGGIPVVEAPDGTLAGTAAVIDKDLAAERLAEDVNADTLLILTAVERISTCYGRPDQQDLARMSVQQAEQYIREGHFAPGSMLPKVQAALRFVKSGPGRRAIVTSLEKAAEALQGRAGTELTA
ncbi:MAG: carbamate kinase [Clostridiales bacterium]|nr:carbamate kinase [Clostridiales bacterium]